MDTAHPLAADVPAPSDAYVHRPPVAALSLAALGVVYGDIGTSPLYAIKECFAPHRGLPPMPANVLGILSLVLWSLLVVIVLKYLSFIMQAHNRGEGGILALMALLGPAVGRTPALISVGLFGAALLYGDGVITPAISVLSAMEGLKVATPRLVEYVVPATVVILAALFLVQRRGTARVGALFGPVTLVWFVTIAAVGVPWIAAQPAVLAAVNPLHAVRFLARHGFNGFLLLGAVVLCITGGEALYADMGHFGARPIRLAWYGVVMPALVLNYFGQGAFLLDKCHAVLDGPCRAAVAAPFYALVPGWFVLPMVVIAAVATVVASQALISGAFSLTQQAVQLGFVPRMKIVHTSATTEGQIYIPVVNGLLTVACVALVMVAANSSNLASAYGIAVTGTMSITSVLFYAVARRCWCWPVWRAAGLVGVFLVVDLAFFAANLAKILHGGWFPMLAAGGVFAVMSTWRFGASWRARELAKLHMPFDELLAALKLDPPGRTSYFLGRETFVSTGRSELPGWRRALFLFLARNARSPTEFFAIPPNQVVEIGGQMEV